MSFEPKDTFGALFKNDKKGNDKAPDYKGNIMLGGKQYELAGWIKSGAKGNFLSLKGGEPRQQDAKRVAGDDDTRPRGRFDDPDAIPF